MSHCRSEKYQAGFRFQRIHYATTIAKNESNIEQYDQAKAAYRRVLDRDQNHAKVLQQLGWLHHQQSNSFSSQEAAIEYLEKSVNSGMISSMFRTMAQANTWQTQMMHRVGISWAGVTCHSRSIQRRTKPTSKPCTAMAGTRRSGARLVSCITRSISTEMHSMRTPVRYASIRTSPKSGTTLEHW